MPSITPNPVKINGIATAIIISQIDLMFILQPSSPEHPSD
jgi:hypothetical protein